MAEVTTKRAGVTFVVELTEQEAQYVEAALARVVPAHFEDEDDPVWDALGTAMWDAGVSFDRSSVV